MNPLRIGIVGLGAMGSFHAGYMDRVEGARLAALCDPDLERLEKVAGKYEAARSGTEPVARFMDPDAMLRSGAIDAVMIATPHPLHPQACRAAFEHGVHVLCEKPIAVTLKQAQDVLAAHAKRTDLKFALMLQMRTLPLYRRLRQIITGGELGDVSRITWIITDWFRTWTYYGAAAWRATWAGEGGGVLINQCPHNLDMIQWATGLRPSKVTAVANIGKTHPIEVEDEASAILEYSNGAIGHFVTTTGEAPGSNRFEVCGDRGKVIIEGGKLVFHRTKKSVREIRETSDQMFVNVETETIEEPLPADGVEPHKIIVENFVRAIQSGEQLIAPGDDGTASLELGNAMLMSGLTRRPVTLPLDSAAFEKFFVETAREYGGRKTIKVKPVAAPDMATSFSKP